MFLDLTDDKSAEMIYSDNSLAPNRHEAIFSASVGSVYWCTMSQLALMDNLISYWLMGYMAC